MNKTIGSILFWALLLGALGYGAYSYYNHSNNNPEEETPLPERVHQRNLKQSGPPMEKFQEDMGKRMRQSKERGVDLGKSKQPH